LRIKPPKTRDSQERFRVFRGDLFLKINNRINSIPPSGLQKPISPRNTPKSQKWNFGQFRDFRVLRGDPLFKDQKSSLQKTSSTPNTPKSQKER